MIARRHGHRVFDSKRPIRLMLSSPPVFSSAGVWFIGLSIALVWVVFTVALSIPAGPLAAASLVAGIAFTLGMTWLLARSTRRVTQYQLLLEQASRSCQQQLARLNSQQEQTNAVLQNLDSGVIVVDPQGRVSLVNAAAKRFFSISSQPLGHPLVESVRQPELLDAVRQVLIDRSPREVMAELRDEAGVRRVLRVLCIAVGYEQGISVLLAARDESEYRLIEEMRREFVANVSHELKTPLAAIKGYAETVELAIGDDREAALHFISQIHEQCRRLERLVADMMTLARAQAGAQHLRATTVDLAAVIAESIATYAPVAAAKAIRLENRCQGDSPVLVFADREATLTIANNVIGNAVRYSCEGGQVVASARCDGKFGILIVRDDGIGIPEHEQKRIFERFYRADKARNPAHTGTGLGLAIVKNLTQAQGGKIQLQSRPGHGSTFEISLPVPPPPETS